MFLQSFDKSFVLPILTLIETETRVQEYFDTPFLNFKIFLKVYIKFLHKPNLVYFMGSFVHCNVQYLFLFFNVIVYESL
jgi:hypothetical protein